MMGSANDYKLELTPNPSYKKAAVLAPADGLDYKLTIEDVKLYIYVKKMTIPSQISTCTLNECNVQSKPWQYALQFTLPKNIHGITVWVQSNQAGKSPVIPQSRFVVKGGEERNLESLQLSFGGITKTSTPWSSSWGALIGGPRQNGLLQRY